MSLSRETQELYKAASAAREHAYAPYSHCKVGAAVRTRKGQVFSGCNVENSSYGLSCCAERVAIQKAVSEGEAAFTEFVVVTDSSPAWSPCGACRQVMLEFAPPATPVHLINVRGEGRVFKLGDLLPDAFSPANLPKG